MENLLITDISEICLFCNKPFAKRKKGDHVVPQGMGIFHPEFILHNVCTECDNRHGHTFERVALRTGLMGFFRLRKQIKSKNNKNDKPFNPFFDDKFGNKSGNFSISNKNGDKTVPSFFDDGTVYAPQEMRLLKGNQVEQIILIPAEQDISKICDFISDTFLKYKNDFQIELRLNNFQKEAICKELEVRGRKLGQFVKLPREESHEIFNIHSVMGEPHFRFIASIPLKAIIYCDYPLSLLHPLINFVDKGVVKLTDITTINVKDSAMAFSQEPDLHELYHFFEWTFSQDRIIIKARFLAHRNKSGLCFFFSFPQGICNDIIIPFGSLLLKYGKTSKDGLVCLKRGQEEIKQ
jgi:hypothetical protein